MCGIVGMIAHRRPVEPFLLEGLRRMEYRGYDSAGFAVINGGQLHRLRHVGNIAGLTERIAAEQAAGNGAGLFGGPIGIAHTRWATHGEVNVANAHPHVDCTGKLAIVHNGIIENYRLLREALQTKGHTFVTRTDTEILAHLIEEALRDWPLPDAVPVALKHVEGTYGLAVVSADFPDMLMVARNGSPLFIGMNGGGERIVASDQAAIIGILGRGSKAIELQDGQVAIVERGGQRIFTLANEPVDGVVEDLPDDLATIERGAHPTFMHKEIWEQPIVLRRAMAGRLQVDTGVVRLGGLEDHRVQLQGIEEVYITACGTSFYAGMVGQYLFERYAGLRTRYEEAPEFHYRDPILHPKTAVIVLSQSGETADTLGAVRVAKQKGALVLGVVNVVGSQIARETDCGVYIHAGPEIGVASTKAFTTQVMVLAQMALWFGQLRKVLSPAEVKDAAAVLKGIPDQVERVLQDEAHIAQIAAQYAGCSLAYFLGRDANFPAAREGALKVKEISHLYAEGYGAAEMKHGPIAQIRERMPVVVICTDDALYSKVRNNMEQVRSRGGHIIAIATEGDMDIASVANHVIFVPRLPKEHSRLYPLLTVPALQLFAYHIAVLQDCNVDQPRNLAKAVTVE